MLIAPLEGNQLPSLIKWERDLNYYFNTKKDNTSSYLHTNPPYAQNSGNQLQNPIEMV